MLTDQLITSLPINNFMLVKCTKLYTCSIPTSIFKGLMKNAISMMCSKKTIGTINYF